VSGPGAAAGPGSGPGAEAYRPFRPRRGRRVALTLAALSVAGSLLLAIVGPEGDLGWKTPDRVTLFLFGCAVAALLWRYASLSAVPSEQGLVVRNLMLSRTLTWAQIVQVHLVLGAPWVTLDLADGDDLAVMAIQKADGDFGRAEAQRLAALVDAHSATEPPYRSDDQPS
jgi:hypothetical protein